MLRLETYQLPAEQEDALAAIVRLHAEPRRAYDGDLVLQDDLWHLLQAAGLSFVGAEDRETVGPLLLAACCEKVGRNLAPIPFTTAAVVVPRTLIVLGHSPAPLGPDARGCLALPGLTGGRAESTHPGPYTAAGLARTAQHPGDSRRFTRRRGAVRRIRYCWFRVMLAAEAAGVAGRALDLALGHTRTRVQFGRSVASFQAIQHQLADLLVDVENARSAYLCAAELLDPSDPDSAGLTALTALAAENALRVTERALQLHGATGYTWGHDLHLLLRRAKVCSLLGGTAAADFASSGRALLEGRLSCL